MRMKRHYRMMTRANTFETQFALRYAACSFDQMRITERHGQLHIPLPVSAHIGDMVNMHVIVSIPRAMPLLVSALAFVITTPRCPVFLPVFYCLLRLAGCFESNFCPRHGCHGSRVGRLCGATWWRKWHRSKCIGGRLLLRHTFTPWTMTVPD